MLSEYFLQILFQELCSTNNANISFLKNLLSQMIGVCLFRLIILWIKTYFHIFQPLDDQDEQYSSYEQDIKSVD